VTNRTCLPGCVQASKVNIYQVVVDAYQQYWKPCQVIVKDAYEVKEPAKSQRLEPGELQHVLLISLHEDLEGTIQALLRETGQQFRLKTAVDRVTCLLSMDLRVFDAILLRGGQSYQDDIDFLQEVRQSGIQTPIIVLLPDEGSSSAVWLLEAGADAYLLDCELTIDRLANTLRQSRKLFSIQRRATQTEAALQRDILALEEDNIYLDTFAGMVAHNLKNCLYPIVGMTHLLAADYGPAMDEHGNYLLECVLHSADRGVEVIDGLLSLAKMGHESPIPTVVDTGDVMARVMQQLEQKIAETEATIVQPQSWPLASGHALWVEEIWLNYLTNAMKYGGAPPKLTLGAKRIGNRVRFWVRDEGAGLSKEDQDQLFLPFSRLQRKFHPESHGLGLAIVRMIVEKLGGEAGVDSKANEGSTFWFTLPAVRE
jgi:signal transduction histidine kinase